MKTEISDIAQVTQVAGLLPRRLCVCDFRWAAVAAVLALCMIPFTDATYAPIHQFLNRLPFDELFSTTRQITGATVLGTIFCVFLFVAPPKKRLAAWWLGAALLLGCAVNSTVKDIAGRVRPEFGIGIEQMDERDGGYRRMSTYIADNPDTPLRVHRGDQWLLAKSNRPWFNSMTVSFPSGHTMTAFCLAGFFSLLFPRGKWLWYVWAVACGLSRVWGRRHFIDDTLMGAAVGHSAFLVACAWAWPGVFGAWVQRKLHLLFPKEQPSDNV